MARRPKYLNLFAIRLPLPGVVSILHRVSGAVLFLALPAFLYLFQRSLASPEAYAALATALHHACGKICVLVLAAAFFYHACAGIRHLALDLHLGMYLKAARVSSALVILASVVLTLCAAVALW